MKIRLPESNTHRCSGRGLLLIPAVVALLLPLVPAVRAQSVDFEPAALGKQRTALYLKAIQVSLADLESDVNHLAVLSETCRAEYGAKACGLADKALGSDKIEERYDYYIRRPVEAHFSGQGVKIERRNWQGSDAPGASESGQGRASK